ncbi:MAG: 1-(5-phosphoribosyl)-5-[(5-phosphoribosylamino)methylideneamino]imidazole-4-carboxamide isomerase [Sedimentisphaerales bacterium]|nr:1-(5-phosphoribosyl)-5-[(5-phosphoribosylamino)methylideneamino]imidazole-4-carboxamide isomerase [Sedimentisphaerales bacterium]
MYIIPAIDLIGGRCVRLIQGRYDRQLIYRDDPVEQAQEFALAGAKWLHIVDLEGAKEGRPVNAETLAAIAALKQMKIEVGGGIRDDASIGKMLDMGIERVIVGSRAVSEFQWFEQIAKKFAPKIVLGLDARGRTVAKHGWTKDSGLGLLEFAVKAAKLPIAAIIYTDIAKDGMMEGPNFDTTERLIEAVDVPVIASGGITKTDDIKKLAELGAEAAIVGRAIYEGALKLSDAIAAAQLC